MPTVHICNIKLIATRMNSWHFCIICNHTVIDCCTLPFLLNRIEKFFEECQNIADCVKPRSHSEFNTESSYDNPMLLTPFKLHKFCVNTWESLALQKQMKIFKEVVRVGICSQNTSDRYITHWPYQSLIEEA